MSPLKLPLRSLALALTLGLALPFSGGAASAANGAPAGQADKGPQVANPVEEFNRALGEVKKNLGGFNSRIEQSAKDIEKLSAPDAARKELAELQALVADALGTVSDNGSVATLGQKVLDFARAKQRQFESDGKYSAEERAFLQKEWGRIATEAKRSIDDLSNARQEFTNLLRTVQNRSDYIEELQALNNADQMLQVIKQLADDIRTASSALKSFIQTVTPPTPGT